MTPFERVALGYEESPSDFLDEHVRAWRQHGRGSLHGFLGMTEDEYAQWTAQPEQLKKLACAKAQSIRCFRCGRYVLTCLGGPSRESVSERVRWYARVLPVDPEQAGVVCWECYWYYFDVSYPGLWDATEPILPVSKLPPLAEKDWGNPFRYSWPR